MANEKLALELELRKKELAIKRAETAKEEIDVKLLERELEVERMKEHKNLQDVHIEKIKKEIEEIKIKIADFKKKNTQGTS